MRTVRVKHTIKTQDIRENDEFWDDEGKHYWTAKADAVIDGYMVRVNIQHHPDSGLDRRWFNVDDEITIKRPREVAR
jgi:hypothetical protein